MDTMDALETYQKQLSQEEEFITELLRRIDRQINSLQVEQMELQSTMHKRGNAGPKEEKPKVEHLDKSSQQLDLSVPVNVKNDMEEEEEDDDEP